MKKWIIIVAIACLGYIFLIYSYDRQDVVLRISIERGDSEELQKFLNKGGDPNHRFKKTYHRDPRPYLIQIAARAGSTNCLKLLVEHKAKLNVQDDEGWTALFYAVNAGEDATHYSAFCFLLSKGADPNIKNNKSSTILHFTASLGFAAHVEQLLKHGALRQAKDSDGDTPVIVAKDENVKNILLKKE